MTQHEPTNGHAAKLKQPASRPADRLESLSRAEERQVLKAWNASVEGMDGPRGGVPVVPDDPVAHLLVEAAGQAIERGQTQNGIHILKLVVSDYGQSQEAALGTAKE